MIIYNVTNNVEFAIADQWLQWMQHTHIPAVMATGFFLDYSILRLIGDEESGGVTYAIQYKCESMVELNRYIAECAPELRKDMARLYGDKCVSYRSLLEVIK
jgi:hypothetical protein